MTKIDNYLEYRKHKPEYKLWKQNRNLQTAKKLEYIKNNPIDEKQKEEDIKRAKVILAAINTMDEYSQSKAEDMEVYVQGVLRPVSDSVANLATLASIAMIALSKGAQEAIHEVLRGNFNKVYKLLPAFLMMTVPSVLLSLFTSFWGAKKEIEASRNGRKEAIELELSSEKQFAILNEKQEQELDKISNTINVSKKEKRKVNKGLGIIDAFKTIFSNSEGEAPKTKQNKISHLKLSEEEITEAKKDKELIQHIIEKIDIASQDYAENAELATSIITTLAFAGGGMAGFLAKHVSKLLKLSPKNAYIAKLATSYSVILGTAILASKIDKQASRVGRFKAKNELLNHPEELFYVDSDKYQNVGADIKETKNKNFIQTFIQLIKDNNEYNIHTKENNIREIQKRKAREMIEISPEQKSRAKQLQSNVFNMFNILDDKSQMYSETTEALGEFTMGIVSLGLFLPIAMSTMIKETNRMIKTNKDFSPLSWLKIASTFAIPILMNVIVTKEQKNASRVANMQAINELDDYRYFAKKEDISNLQKLDSNEIFKKFIK